MSHHPHFLIDTLILSDIHYNEEKEFVIPTVLVPGDLLWMLRLLSIPFLFSTSVIFTVKLAQLVDVKTVYNLILSTAENWILTWFELKSKHVNT